MSKSNLPNWLEGEEPLPPSKSPKKSGGFNPLALVGGLLLICVLIAGTGAIVRRLSPAGPATPPESAAVAAAAASPAPSEIPPTEAPTNTPEPTSAPEATATAAPVAAPIDTLRAALEAKLSVGTRDVPRLARLETSTGTLFVDWNINDAMSDDGLRRNAKIDAVNILRTIAENDEGVEYNDVSLSGFFPLVDNLGNTRDAMVVQVWYDRATIDAINWDNFFDEQVYGAAKTLRLHDLWEE
jgi:hypothetical protein